MKKRTVALLMAVVLVLGAGIGGTLAWLLDRTDEVVNTFTVSDIDVELSESDNLDLKMIPGWTIGKDPKAKVTSGSEDCYLFVKVEESTNFSDFMTYTIADGWDELTLTGVNYKVYYKVFDSKDAANANIKGTDYPVLKDNQVTVKDSVTKAMMNALTDATRPTLTFTAYAAQLYKSNTEKFTAADAWVQAQNAPTPTPAA